MAPPDRLTELRRQRALLQQHTSWLDREISRASLNATLEGSPAVAPPTPDPSVTLRAAEPLITADPDAILSQYRSDEGRLKTDVRKGCLLYSLGAFSLLGLSLLIVYHLLTGSK
ncbi:MAG: hypothetical protein B9S26_05550 [Opitutia bacterium Tous-C4FEB]|nr:MAG: hypothetical protein B9S35_05645 [Opitutae bacterium Tous-C5TDCM]PAW90144.1 MAG: hypothetical protein B9S26_05550 [Opitutae bacterium Tous-C4FEB]